MGAWDDIGKLAASFGVRETEEERRQREEQEALERYVRETNMLSQPIIVHDKIEQFERDSGRRPKETFKERALRYGDHDRTNLEDRRGEPPVFPPPGVAGGPLPPPAGYPNGWDRPYDPRWVGPDGRLRDDAPPEVRQAIEEAARWTELRGERELIDDEYEPTDSPLVLMKRNANGTVTYVHAMTGQPLYDEGLYGMNDPQGAETENPWDDVLDPYWREGRRDW